MKTKTASRFAMIAKFILCALLCACTGCAGITLSASRKVGDGKAYAEVSDDGAFIGYKGKWGKGPKVDAKGVTPLQKESKTGGWFNTLTSWYR